MNSLFKFDKQFNCKIIGTDEAGRGPGAGGVFAAAVYFRDNTCEYKILSKLNDSKKLSPSLREELAEAIKKCANYSIKCVEVDKIEQINILNASLLAMKLAIEDIIAQNSLVLVDGNRSVKDLFYPQKTITKGDLKSASIAAASILAKVARDSYMRELHLKYPQYAWVKNKGYLTKEHIQAIKTFGITEFHRPSFLRKIML